MTSSSIALTVMLGVWSAVVNGAWKWKFHLYLPSKLCHRQLYQSRYDICCYASIDEVITHQHGIAERGGCFQRCLFLCLFVFAHNNHHSTTVLRPFFRDHLHEPLPEENFWTLWCKGRLTEADTQTIRLVATLSRLTSAHLHHPPIFYSQMPNQRCQSTEGN